MSNTLFLRLEGPLQAWGERARWSVRDTASEPTKSGVVGMLACAMGWCGDDELRTLSQALRMGVRCDRPGQVITDYHTVEGGVMSAEGKIKINATTRMAETVVSWRQYLCDASFLVAVQGEPTLIERLAQAIQRPEWPIYLGRRSCVPARPPYAGAGDYPSLTDALQDGRLCEPLPAGESVIDIPMVVEATPADGMRRREEVWSRTRRVFGPRFVKEGLAHVRAGARGT